MRDAYGTADKLYIGEAPKPKPGPGDSLIRRPYLTRTPMLE